MAQLLKFEALGYRDISGRFARRSVELAQAQRDGMRDLGRAGVEIIKRYAPKDTGAFSEGIRYRTEDTGHSTRLTFYVGGEHAFVLPFLVEGTVPHLIPSGGAEEQIAKGYPLHWVDESGADHFAWEVWHPGTDPDPFLDIAFDAMEPQRTNMLRTVATRVVWLT